jgi:tripartite-type tricarboxylate transporter receptor subunit TctC
MLLFALLLIPAAASAQAYPAKSIRVIVPFAPGGGTDILTRVISPKLGDALGQQIVVDNRAGAGSTIGSELVVKAAPDGYTLLMVDTSFTTNPSLYSKLPYDSARDFTPVSLLASAPVILIVHPSVPVRTVKEFVGARQSKAGTAQFRVRRAGQLDPSRRRAAEISGRDRSPAHSVQGHRAGVADVLGGQVVMMFAGISSVKQHVRVGRLRAIAVTGDKRSPAMPEVPTFIESGLRGVDSGTYWGCLAPAGTARDVVKRVSSAMAGVLKLPDINERLIDLGFDPIGGTPEQFAATIRAKPRSGRG